MVGANSAPDGLQACKRSEVVKRDPDAGLPRFEPFAGSSCSSGGSSDCWAPMIDADSFVAWCGLDGCKVSFREIGGVPKGAAPVISDHSGALPLEIQLNFQPEALLRDREPRGVLLRGEVTRMIKTPFCNRQDTLACRWMQSQSCWIVSSLP